MSENLKQKMYIFSVISRIRDERLRQMVLREFIQDPKFYDALSEIAINTIKGKIPLKACDKKKLKSCKQGIICLAKRQPLRERKKVVKHLRGGFWTYLIPIVFELLKSAVN